MSNPATSLQPAAAAWRSAAELRGLPGLPSTARRCRDALRALGVASRVRQAPGGGLEWDCAALPAETRAALVAEPVQTAPAAFAPPMPKPSAPPMVPAPAPKPGKPVTPASDAAKAVADARVTLVRCVQDAAPLRGWKRAYSQVAAELAAGSATPALQDAATAANERARGTPISARTLERWCAAYRKQGWAGLLPAPQQAQPLAYIEEDVAAVLGLYHSTDPAWRNLTRCAHQVTRQLGRAYDDWRPLYGRARRALAKVDRVGLIKSRHTGGGRAALLPFKRRDTSMLAPLDVWVVDGHTFKAKVRHPDHGAPFAPELTLVLDAATRRIMGWSVALAESTIAVGDALRHAVGQHGVPAIVYSDNGPGESAKVFDCPVDGIMARLGIEHRTGIPGHPQGHGIIERSWRTHAINCARQFGSFQGGDADGGTYRKVAAKIAKEQRALRRAEATGDVIRLIPELPTWQQFIDAVQAMVADYNAHHRHRGLPKDAAGKHMTPDAAWAAMFRPELEHRLGPLALRQMFMPAVQRVAQRGEVTFFNQHYAAPELMGMGVDGHAVSVRYDIHDPHSVEIYSLAGDWICRAAWDANRIDYYPKSVVQMAQEKRTERATKRLQQKIELAARELMPTVQPATLSLPEPSASVVQVPAVVEVGSYSSPKTPSIAVASAQADAGRPFFDTPSDRYEWLMRHSAAWSGADRDWLAVYVSSDDYAGLRDYYAGRGLAWGERAADGFEGAQASANA